MTGTTAGVSKKGARMSIIDDGVLSADIPTVAEVLTTMNTDHFSIISDKINIKTILDELKGPLSSDTFSGPVCPLICMRSPRACRIVNKYTC